MTFLREEYEPLVRHAVRPIWWLPARRSGRPWKRNKWRGYGR